MCKVARGTLGLWPGLGQRLVGLGLRAASMERVRVPTRAPKILKKMAQKLGFELLDNLLYMRDREQTGVRISDC